MRKVSPLKRYGRPAYPTIDEIGLADLSRTPVRWARLRSVVQRAGARERSARPISSIVGYAGCSDRLSGLTLRISLSSFP